MVKGIDFCICTHNRKEYLALCVEALLPQLAEGMTVMTIVDNRSTDGTKDYVLSLQKEIESIRYVYEEEEGLSHARNAGWNTSSSEWIFYLDDDCLPPAGLVASALALIEKDLTFDAFGGPIEPLFLGAIPEWLPEDFGRFRMTFPEMTRLDKGFIRGGCFLIRRSVLEKLNGFNPLLGVKGRALRYGEEFDLQVRMRKAGFSIAYAPALRMGHFVRTEKLSVQWMIHSTYARHRDRMAFNPIAFSKASFDLVRTSLGRIIWTPLHLIQSITVKNYSLRRACLDILQPLALRTGEWVGTLRHLKRK
jgi:GT2 family glycosyltransferase